MIRRFLRSLRAIFRLFRIALHLLWGTALVATVYSHLAPDAQWRLRRRWFRQTLRFLGVTVCIRGPAPVQSVLVVSNHVSWLDIFVIGQSMPVVFVAKSEVRQWPVIGWLAHRVGTFFVVRGSARSAHNTHRRMAESLARGCSMAIFPEGTTSDGREVLPFAGALLEPAARAGVHLQPVALRYLDRHGARSLAPVFIGDTSLAESLWRLAAAPAVVARVDFLPKKSPGHQKRGELAAELRHTIHATLWPQESSPTSEALTPALMPVPAS